MVVSTYKRPKSVRELLVGLQELDKMDRVRNWLLTVYSARQIALHSLNIMANLQ